ncbi:hypothetical protein ABK040_012854 [Willaertia magna]
MQYDNNKQSNFNSVNNNNRQYENTGMDNTGNDSFTLGRGNDEEFSMNHPSSPTHFHGVTVIDNENDIEIHDYSDSSSTKGYHTEPFSKPTTIEGANITLNQEYFDNTKHQPNNNNNNNQLSLSHSVSFETASTLNILKTLKDATTVEQQIKEAQENTNSGAPALFKWISEQRFVWTYLSILGLIGGFIAFSHDMLVEYIFKGRLQMIDNFGNDKSSPSNIIALQMFLWIIYNLIFVVFALLMTALISPAAEGSGIPPVKAILTGVDSLRDPLSFKTLMVKVFCLPCVLGAGMFAGKVGPTIHIGACLAEQLLRLKIFEGIRKNKSLRAQMIACGCAMGIGANFGTPAGGVLFALEAVGTYYSLRNYLKSFYVAVFAAFTSRLLHCAVDRSLYILPNWIVYFNVPSYTIPDLIPYAMLGVVMGFLGVLFTFINEKMLLLRDKIGNYYLGPFKFGKLFGKKYLVPLQNKFLWAVFICIVTSIVTFPYFIGKFMSLEVSKTVEDLFLSKPLLPGNGAKGEWTNVDSYNAELFKNLTLFVLIRIIVSTLTVSLPMPAGIYVPLLVMGAGCGRLWGEFVAFVFPNGFGNGVPVNAGGYAVVGAVALTASSTQAFSTVFILLEVAGIGVYLPSLMAAIISVKISRALYYSIYDSIIKIRGWPAILETQTDSEDLRVKDIMNYVDTLVVLEENTTFQELKNIFEKRKVLPKTFPIVNSKTDLFLLGTISLKKLQELYELKKELIMADLNINRDSSKQTYWTTASHTVETDEGSNSTNNLSRSSSINSIELEDTEYARRKREQIILDYDTCQIAIAEDTPAIIAHLLFSQLRLDDVFVVWMGRLIGQLHREVLIKQIADRNSKFKR